ncbi:RagB/SusD family nutrient uptake outer membrane protein [Mucilaginibacter sp. SMC90]|uniref:RagB/SusD family nutrient uptake outer membrane protein n=1 Tax=Mucilaginibacter sp. SMC90 TaxID=2929803 RepID=UPI001FB4B33C|nr:RagB/SusD family nutrient uptake outer membrane protein [Mucilaginibacter sp. SMC90]UOE51112.1 RagB/SusD family nutrient uptake outer membrane protein [Mucilaginibacter sp. SMC90]
MKKYLLLIICLIGTLGSCKKALDEQPQGVIASDQLNTPENIEKMVVAAYAALGNENLHTSNSLWPWGSMRSGDAYKGGDGVGDNSEWNDYETFVTNQNTNSLTDQMWAQIYNNIARANNALLRLDNIAPSDFSLKTSRQGEMRFLRGNHYFMAKILWNRVPYIDENVPTAEYIKVSNTAMTSDQLWDKIAADFRYAANVLPAKQADAGRPNKYTALAFLAKTLLYQAYKQDDNHNMTGIDQAKLNQVVGLCDSVINFSGYALAPDFGDNFLEATENGPESVFAIQYSKNDGTQFGRIDMGHSLTYPMNPEYGCCWQHIPSQDLVNNFKTDASGLPMFTGYNNTDATKVADFLNQTFDPRLDHTVGIPGHPFKYVPTFVYQTSWARAPAIYGYFTSMKDDAAANDPSFQKIPPFMSSSKNWELIRFADVLLWKAEALIELNRPNEALPLINMIRQRAGNSTARLKQADGSFTSNYKVSLYQPGVNCVWTQDYARQALRRERRLEFAMEGNRFFDLVRWGIADTYLNSYFTSESTKRTYLKTAKFTKGRDEYLPIPLNQINYSKGLYKQNPGF